MIELTCGTCDSMKDCLIKRLEGMVESFKMAHEQFEKDSPFAADILRGYFIHELKLTEELLNQLRSGDLSG